MDLGWITTFASPDKVEPQLSVATEGGSGTAVPDISVEVDDLDEALRRVRAAGLSIEYGPADEDWDVRASTYAIHLGGWSIFSLTCDRLSVWALANIAFTALNVCFWE